MLFTLFFSLLFKGLRNAKEYVLTLLAGHELICEPLLHLGVLLPLLVLLLGVLGPLLVEDSLLGVGELGALLATQGQREVRLVPGERVVTRVVEATGSVFFPSSSGGILDRKWKMKNKR